MFARWVWVAAMVATAACSSTSTNSGSGGSCTVGASQGCSCLDAKFGVQTCLPNRQLSACITACDCPSGVRGTLACAVPGAACECPRPEPEPDLDVEIDGEDPVIIDDGTEIDDGADPADGTDDTEPPADDDLNDIADDDLPVDDDSPVDGDPVIDDDIADPPLDQTDEFIEPEIVEPDPEPEPEPDRELAIDGEQVPGRCIEIVPSEGVDLPATPWDPRAVYDGPGIRFDPQFVGLERRRGLFVWNCGTEPLTVGSIAWGQFDPFRDVVRCGQNSNTCDFAADPPLPIQGITIDPGDTVRVTDVIYRPTGAGSRNFRLIVQTDAEVLRIPGAPGEAPQLISGTRPGDGSGPAAVIVWLTGGSPDLFVSPQPEAIDFGTLTLGCCSDWYDYAVNKRGTEPVTVRSVGFTTPPSGLGMNPGATPVTLEGEARFTGQIRWCPNRVEAVSGSIDINTDLRLDRLTKIRLAGASVAGDGVTERFAVAEPADVDMLFVIDNSGSMQEEQQAIANNFTGFANVALQSSVGFQFGIVTTDMEAGDQAGRLRGSPRIKTRNTPDFIDRFRTDLQQGTQGSGTEQGLAAVRAALTEPLTSRDNTGFLRPNADLAVLLLSDEEDQSPGATADYIEFLRSLKPAGTEVRVYAIVGPDGGCQGAGGTADAGARYTAVATAMGGFSYPICNTSYAPAFTLVSNDLFAPRRRFRLAREPDPATIRVTVGARTITAWRWEAPSRAVVLTDPQDPPVGSTVQIDYRARCIRP